MPAFNDEFMIKDIAIEKEIINYKKTKIKEWQEKNVLPERNIHFIGVDFSKNYKQGLFSKIQSIKGNKSTFILIEGVLFFLTREETNDLFNFFDTIQTSDDYIGSASFQETIKDTKAFQNLLDFFNKKVSKTTESDYQTIENQYYKSKENYKLIDHQDYFSLSKKYGNNINQSKELILNENFYLLKKTEKKPAANTVYNK